MEGSVNGEENTSRRRSEANMGWIEVAKYSSLLAFSDAIDDMDDYYLYFLAAKSHYGCDCTGYLLGALALAKTIFYFFAKPAAGWVADAFNNHQHLTLIISSIAQLISSIIFIYFAHMAHLPLMILIYLAHKLCIQVNSTVLWKVVKFRAQFIYGKEQTEKQEVKISLIGVLQGIISDVYETASLALTFLIMNNGSDFKTSNIFLYSTIIFGNVYIALLSLSITRNSLYHKDEDPANRPLLTNEELGVDDIFFGVRVGEEPTRQPPLLDLIGEKLNGIFTFFFERLKSFFSFKLALHAICMSWILYTFTNMIETPISFAVSKIHDHDPTSSGSLVEPPCHNGEPFKNSTFTPENFCHGDLKNLIQESMTDNVAYAIGSAIYLVLLVRCPPRYFYHFVFPAVTLVSAGFVVLLWILVGAGSHSKFLIYAVKSFLLTVPYYMEKYNFYFWTSAIDESYFGFYYGTYGLVQNTIHVTSAVLLDKFSDSLKPNSSLFNGILALNFVLILLDYIYCIWFARANRRVLFTPTGDHVQQAVSDADIVSAIPEPIHDSDDE